MIVIKDQPFVTAEQARSILARNTDEMGVFMDLDRICEYQLYFTKHIRPLKREFRKMAGVVDIEVTKLVEVRSVLMNRFNVPLEYFQDKFDRNKLKLDKAVVETLLNAPDVNDDAKHFLKLIKTITSGSRRVSYLKQYVGLPICKVEAYDNARMVIAKPTWNVLSTSRISAEDPSIQNVYRDFADLITYPKGYLLLRSDSAQIEPRIIYSYFIQDDRIKQLILEYDDAYYGLLHYAMYNDALHKIELTPKQIEYRSQLKTMSNATNYGGALDDNRFDPQISRAFLNRIQKHPGRLDWLQRVEEDVARGAREFYSAFGTKIVPPPSKKYPLGSPQWIKHLVRCGINNPVQGTAGDLMNQSVYESDKLLREKAKDFSRIGYYKHDEGAWYLAERDAHLKDELGSLMGYLVRDWIPINFELIEGRKKGYDMSDLLNDRVDEDE